ncbi:MAG: hypothetical protein RH860_06665 [Cytophagales bacterium]
MKHFFTRPDWPKFDRSLFQIILVLTGITFALFIYALTYEGSFVFPMETRLVPDIAKVKLFNYISPYGDFSPGINSLINFQKYYAGEFEMPIRAGQLFQISFFLCIVVLSTMVVRISGWLFYIGISLIILFLVYFKIQEFGIMSGYEDYLLYALCALLAGFVFYLHNYHFEKSFKFHFLLSALAWGLLWIIILLFGKGNELLFQLSNFAFPACILISVVFIILIGHEPIHVFFAMISYSSNQFSRARIVNFIILSLLYLGNVGLSYAKTIGKIDWDIIYTPFQLMLLFAIIAGYYGFQKRFDSVKLFESRTVLLIVYSTLSLFTLSFLSFAYFSGHDAIVEIIEDATLYSQLGMGTIFFFYLIVNFGDLLQQKVKAYKVVYRPERFPILTAFIGGIVIMVAMFMRSGMFPYYQSMGIIYSGMADNYLVNGDVKMAQVFYEEASVFAFNNSRTTMNQADIYKKEGNRQGTVLSLKNSIFKNPEPVHFIDLAAQFEQNDKFFDAVFSLQEGISKFPESNSISNNLALLYTKSKLYDSAFIYFNKTDDLSRERNLSAMLSKASYFNPDSLPELSKNDITEITNRISIYNKALVPFADSMAFDILKDSVIEFAEYSYFYNLNINKLLTSRSILRNDIEQLLKLNLSDEYFRDLYLLRGMDAYFKNNIADAISDFENAINFSGMTSAYVSDLVGTLLMAKELYGLAEPFMERAERAVYENSPIKLLAIYSENEDKEKLQSLLSKSYVKKLLGDSTHKEWSAVVYNERSYEDIDTSNELMAYVNFKLHKEEFTKEEFEEMPNSFKNDYLRLKTSALVLKHLIENEALNTIEAFYLQQKNILQNSSELDELFLSYLYLENHLEKFKSYLAKAEETSLYYPLYKAWQNKTQANTSEFLRYAEIAVQSLGYDPNVMLLKIDLMKANGKDDTEIYYELVNDLMVYPENEALEKAYVLQAAKIGLESFAEKELEDLKNKLQAEEYRDFFTEYQKILQEHALDDNW